MRAVIFDLDGVLVRTDQAHDKAWRALAGRLGIPFDGRAAARLRGVSRMEALDIVVSELYVYIVPTSQILHNIFQCDIVKVEIAVFPINIGV